MAKFHLSVSVSFNVQPMGFGPARRMRSCSFHVIACMSKTKPIAAWSDGIASVLLMAEPHTLPIVLKSMHT